MKYIVSIIAILSAFSLCTAHEASAAGMMGQSYGGTGATNGFVSKTGLVKERTDDEDQMKGSAETSDDEEADKLDEKEDSDEDKNNDSSAKDKGYE